MAGFLEGWCVAPAHAGMDRSRFGIERVLPRRPRPRGDGPRPPAIGPGFGQSPPPTRGWTWPVIASRHHAGVAPAHAGMDPAAWSLPNHPRGRPRPRGDGPNAPRGSYGHEWSPPPTRGWTRLHPRRHRRHPVAPAHAGMDPPAPAPPSFRTRRPRPRGDGPTRHLTASGIVWSPPPTRGWTGARRPHCGRAGVAPAHAGMDRTGPWCSPSIPGRPRPRGDGPVPAIYSPEGRASPPPTRGWTLGRVGRIGDVLVAPAHAGMDLVRLAQPRANTGRPRPRGDGPAASSALAPHRASPPHTRGWTSCPP